MKYCNNDDYLRSDYEYLVHARVIAIKDLDAGGMSVTNNIENIVGHICDYREIDPNDYTIVYQDSQGELSFFQWSTKKFSQVSFQDKKQCLKLIP